MVSVGGVTLGFGTGALGSSFTTRSGSFGAGSGFGSGGVEEGQAPEGIWVDGSGRSALMPLSAGRVRAARR